MIAIPLIDLRHGTCDQLTGGSYTRRASAAASPRDVLRNWIRCGFTRIQVVDRDAFAGHGSNAGIVRELLFDPDVTLQVGGNLRTTSQVEGVLDAGAHFAVLGSRALEDDDWLAEMAGAHPGTLIVAADVRDRRLVMPDGARVVPRSAVDLVESLASLPLAGILVAVTENGSAVQGRELRALEEFVDVAGSPIIAMGGASTMTDLRALHERGVAGVVIGAPLYSGALAPSVVADEFSD